MLARRFPRLLHVAGDAGVAREVAVDVGLRRAAFQPELAGEAEGAHAVDQAEVDALGDATLVGADFERGDAEDLAGRCPVHVLAVREGVEQALVTREVGHDAQFDLRIIGRNNAAARWGDEGGADLAAFLTAHRDVLQVGVARGEAAGDYRRLREVSMHSPGIPVDHPRQLVSIGALELGQTAVFEQQLGQRVVEGQFGEHLLVGRWATGRRLFLDRQSQLFEQNVGQLLR